MNTDKEFEMNLQDTPIEVDPATESVQLNGWDMVFAITFKDVNAAIKSKKSSPKTFEFSKKDSGQGPFAGTYNLKGQYDDWRMALGGDGTLIRMDIPAKTLQLDVTIGGKVYLYSITKGVTFTIEVHFDWKKEEDKVHLVLGEENHKQSLAVMDITFNDPNEGKIIEADGMKPILSDLVREMLTADVEDFDHVFATVDYAKDLTDTDLTDSEHINEKFKWLKPTSHHYGVAQRKSTNKNDDPMSLGILHIMSMSENRPNPSTGNAPNNIIPPGANAGFAFHERFVIQNFILPAMPLIFPDCDISKDFVMTSDGCKFTNTKHLLMKEMERDHTWAHVSKAMVTLQAPTTGFSVYLEKGHIIFDMAELKYERTERLNGVFMVKQKCSMTMNKEGRFGIVVPPQSESSIKHYLMPIEREGGAGEFWLSLAKETLINMAIMCVCFCGASYISRRVRIKNSSYSSEGGKTTAEIKTGKAKITEVEVTFEEGIEAANHSGETSVSSETIDGSDISKNTIEETISNNKTGKPGKFSKFIGSSMGEFLMMSFFQMLITDTMTITKFYTDYVAKDNFDVKALYSIAGVGLSRIDWPNASDKGYQVVEGGLRDGSFRIGVNMKFEH